MGRLSVAVLKPASFLPLGDELVDYFGILLSDPAAALLSFLSLFPSKVLVLNGSSRSQ